MCVNGPRDMIDLCNRCAEHAQGAPITVRDRDAVLAGYSEAKISEVGADFGDVYPDVEKLARQVLYGCSSAMKVKVLTTLYEQKVVKEQKISDAFGLHTWFKMLGPSDFAPLMYKVGVIGVKDAGRDIYAIEDPERSTNASDQIVIHPAFRPVLGVS